MESGLSFGVFVTWLLMSWSSWRWRRATRCSSSQPSSSLSLISLLESFRLSLHLQVSGLSREFSTYLKARVWSLYLINIFSEPSSFSSSLVSPPTMPLVSRQSMMTSLVLHLQLKNLLQIQNLKLLTQCNHILYHIYRAELWFVNVLKNLIKGYLLGTVLLLFSLTCACASFE